MENENGAKTDQVVAGESFAFPFPFSSSAAAATSEALPPPSGLRRAPVEDWTGRSGDLSSMD